MSLNENEIKELLITKISLFANTEIEKKQKRVDSAIEKLEEAKKSLEDLNKLSVEELEAKYRAFKAEK